MINQLKLIAECLIMMIRLINKLLIIMQILNDDKNDKEDVNNYADSK